MTRLLNGTRYLIIIPIIGLALAAAAFFVFGGIGLISLLIEVLLHGLESRGQEIPFEVEIVEYVHRFLIGTVLYITAVGFYQLFIGKFDFPSWLSIESTEELETNLIGVTVVVLAVHFMVIVFIGEADKILEYGAGIALPILALAVFVGLRTWSTYLADKDDRETPSEEE